MLVPDGVDRAAPRIEVAELLVVVADRDVVARGATVPASGAQAARQRLQEGRLARAVLAEDRQALAAQKLEADAPDDRDAGRVAGVEVLRPQEAAAADPGRVEPEGDRS